LDFRRSGVSSVGAVDADDSGFFRCGDRHCFWLSLLELSRVV
jgi:hypothetical protein